MPQLSPEPDGADEDEQNPPVITARGITMRGPWGPVYGPIDLDIDAGGVTVLVAASGAGRTALLMTLAGRMRPVEGQVTVFDRSRAADIFANTALAGIDELDALAESVTVRDVVTEQLRWDAPWYRRVRPAGPDELTTVLAPVFGDRLLPGLGAYVDELTELDQLLLRVAVANTATPALLVVGNLDRITGNQDRIALLDRLIALGERQTVITASTDPVSHPGVRAQVEVANTTHAELAGLQKGGR
ncbi:ATP-binding cassette domain-containing protein [Mycobacterium sp. DSM 3803]|uniref:ATP-binding cassette domain-containing protein n=1 Tax=Mycolicibacterium sp. TaxID=2320850 RepID=UPI0037C50AD4|nr:ATP-binding cassette domain-containing protein [Mycobacterium sp. DSM 3803]